jgi:hypothetical protein
MEDLGVALGWEDAGKSWITCVKLMETLRYCWRITTARSRIFFFMTMLSQLRLSWHMENYSGSVIKKIAPNLNSFVQYSI